MAIKHLLASSLWRAYNWYYDLQFEKATMNVEETQNKILIETLLNNRTTTYGKRFNFSECIDIASFQANVPLCSFDDLADCVSSMCKGYDSVLTGDPVIRFHLTSGTTSGSKAIPYTRTLQKQFNRAISPWIYDLYSSHQIHSTSAFWVVTPKADIEKTAELPVQYDQDASYFSIPERLLFKYLILSPGELKDVRNTEAYYYVTLLLLLREQDLGWLSIWNPTYALQLMDSLSDSFSSLIADIARGGCSAPGVPEHVLNSLDSRLKASPARAEFLQQILHSTGNLPELISLVWPKLRLISCWTDGWAGSYIAQLKKIFPGCSVQPKGLLATEGIVTMPRTRDGVLQFPLTVSSHFYEFIDHETGETHLATEVVTDREYEVVITTGGGLYRYCTADMVKVTGWYNKAPCLRFIGRRGGISDICGEKLEERFVSEIAVETISRCNVNATMNFLAPEILNSSARYILYLCSDDDKSKLTNLASEVDKGLCRNIHYKNARELGQLEPVAVYAVSKKGEATYYNERCSSGCMGTMKIQSLDTGMNWRQKLDGVLLAPGYHQHLISEQYE